MTSGEDRRGDKSQPKRQVKIPVESCEILRISSEMVGGHWDHKCYMASEANYTFVLKIVVNQKAG